jgi:hypothetical protein
MTTKLFVYYLVCCVLGIDDLLLIIVLKLMCRKFHTCILYIFCIKDNSVRSINSFCYCIGTSCNGEQNLK